LSCGRKTEKNREKTEKSTANTIFIIFVFVFSLWLLENILWAFTCLCHEYIMQVLYKFQTNKIIYPTIKSLKINIFAVLFYIPKPNNNVLICFYYGIILKVNNLSFCLLTMSSLCEKVLLTARFYTTEYTLITD